VRRLTRGEPAAHEPNPISERNNRRRKTKDDLYLDVLDAINKPLPESDGPTAREDIAAGEIRADVDVELANEMLVGPVLARMGSGATAGLDPEETSRRITDLVFGGIRAR
jgi:hypothetical protein